MIPFVLQPICRKCFHLVNSNYFALAVELGAFSGSNQKYFLNISFSPVFSMWIRQFLLHILRIPKFNCHFYWSILAIIFNFFFYFRIQLKFPLPLKLANFLNNFPRPPEFFPVVLFPSIPAFWQILLWSQFPPNWGHHFVPINWPIHMWEA